MSSAAQPLKFSDLNTPDSVSLYYSQGFIHFFGGGGKGGESLRRMGGGGENLRMRERGGHVAKYLLAMCSSSARWNVQVHILNFFLQF